MVSSEFFFDKILPAALLGSTQPLTEMSTRNISWGAELPMRRADNLTIFMCRLSLYLGVSTSWNPQGLSMAVRGLLYLKYYAQSLTEINSAFIWLTEAIDWLIDCRCPGNSPCWQNSQFNWSGRRSLTGKLTGGTENVLQPWRPVHDSHTHL
jgi:hypothetical protein